MSLPRNLILRLLRSGHGLVGKSLRGAQLCGLDLRGTDFRDADLSYADLSGANLTGAALRGADLRGADLTRTDLSNADLTGAKLHGAILRETSFVGCRIHGCEFHGLPEEDLQSCDWTDCQGWGEPTPTVSMQMDIIPKSGGFRQVTTRRVAREPEPEVTPNLTIEMTPDQISAPVMTSILSYLETIVHETSHGLRYVRPDLAGMARDEIRVTACASDPARMVLESTDLNLAVIFAMLMYKNGDETRATPVLLDHFPEATVREILRFVPDRLRPEEGEPLLSVLARLTLTDREGPPRTYENQHRTEPLRPSRPGLE